MPNTLSLRRSRGHRFDVGNMDALSNYQIRKFFEQFSQISKEVCDNEAATIGGGTAKPTHAQGSQSYTVRVGDGTNGSIVQFRDPNHPLDINLLAAAQETYGRLVPKCQYLKGRLDPLHVYTMNDISGESLLFALTSLHRTENFRLLKQTVEDFAVFSASAWRNWPSSMPSFSCASIQSDYQSRLERISNELPDRFSPLLDTLKYNLPTIFTNGYPMVINHWDLIENNIHVDVQTGHLTGIVDWHDAKVGPFATHFWGLENILGVRKSTGMCFHTRHLELRQFFWEKLYDEIGHASEDVRDAIQTARMIGTFLANGDFASLPEVERSWALAVLSSMTLELFD